MTTILLEQWLSKQNIQVKNITELYYFVINSPEFTEMWILDKNELNSEELLAFEKSKKSTNRINI